MSPKLTIRISVLAIAGLMAVAWFALGNRELNTQGPGSARVHSQVASETANAADEPNADRALSELHGETTTGQSASTSTKNSTTSLFAKLKFKHGSDEMLSILLKTKHLDPRTGLPFNCHACGVSLSAVNYVHKGVEWVKMGQSLNFADVGSWGDADAGDWKQLPSELAKDTSAFMFDTGWSGQGYYYNGVYILAFGSSQWKSLGYINTESDNSGDCEDAPDPKFPNDPLPPCWKSIGAIEVLASTTNSYKDIVVRMKGTTNDTGLKIIPAKDVVYKLNKKGVYEASKAH